ncbi:archaea-specific SMC-related protein [Haloplanus halobius]|uniref:archaea-specific SMC-related protein n=1 Tax=Haloplanus halobius TaxID=2934938 RepID=UPI00201038FA|nr:archaea-specific SMC-related protein [Haloplanus sp. XH21]
MNEETRSTAEDAVLSARNIGGIDSASVEFSSGVNVLVGRNATNRTSLLQAVIGALGGSSVTLKGDAEEGETTLELEGETYTRRLVRNGQDVVKSGEPLLEDADVADLFAFLIESNEARQTVARMGDLRNLIMSPVDIDEIKAEIQELKREQKEIEAEIQSIDEEEKQLAGLVQRRSSLEEEIERKEDELEEIRSKIANSDIQSYQRDTSNEELEEKLDERQELESTREDIIFDLQTERQSFESLQAEQSEVEAELDNLPEISDKRIQDVNSRLSNACERQNMLESTINQMQNIIQFNEEQLEDGEGLFGNLQTPDDGGLFGLFRSEANTDLLGALRTEQEEQAVTDQLLDDQQVLTCWTCGSQVKKKQIKEVVGELRDIRSEQLELLNDVKSEIQELKDTKSSLEKSDERRERLEQKQAQLAQEIKTRHDRIEELETRKTTIETEIDELSDEIEALREEIDIEENTDYTAILDLQEDAKRLELEIEQHREEIDDVTEEIDAVESRIDQREELEAEREELRERLTELRQRVEQIEQRAVSEFNERMAEILDILNYSNIERIWIERIDTETAGSSVSTDTSFDIHVVRSTDGGSHYRDTIDHLSESEREVTGLVFALAGYLVHDVHESVPFIVLDSLEAIDSDRIARVVEYLSDYAEYLVVALLPEDAASLNDKYRYMSPPWQSLKNF